ncbi:hypothetical protein KSP35_21820 [Aquihabitans sp. G128]|uniref:hypothetical protein n=1 Tax=Aquihabitans sp. G128 TaxID=2849779 RepID=UPI001C21E012|nr:hypothetical protein [Aquihabitans sp. G128]QXC60921.1 hypothetical protein KSP35_21820 [Aquihabitans sp. G128]
MDVGEAVEVYCAFEQTWTTGFVIADIRDEGYALRRLSDGSLLPAPTAPTDLRAIAPHHWSS